MEVNWFTTVEERIELRNKQRYSNALIRAVKDHLSDCETGIEDPDEMGHDHVGVVLDFARIECNVSREDILNSNSLSDLKDGVKKYDLLDNIYKNWQLEYRDIFEVKRSLRIHISDLG